MQEDIGEFAVAQQKLVQWGIPFDVLFKNRLILFTASFFLSHYVLTFRYLAKSNLVLDVGCGMGLPIKCLRSMGLSAKFIGTDVYGPYLRRVKKANYYEDCVVATIKYPPFQTLAFDSVMCLQVLEHLSKEDGTIALNSLSSVASTVILTTPVGFIKNDFDHSNVFQDHKSGWYPQDLKKLGYKVLGYGGLGIGRKSKLLIVFNVVFAPLIIFFPKIAFHLFAIKTSKKYGRKCR